MRKEKLSPVVKPILDRLKKQTIQRFVDKWIPLILTESNIIDSQKPALLIPQGKDRFIFTKAGYEALEDDYLNTYPEQIRICLRQKRDDYKKNCGLTRRGENLLTLMFDVIEWAEAAYFKENPEAFADVIDEREESWKAAYEQSSKSFHNSVIELAPYKFAVRACLQQRNRRVLDAVKEAQKHPKQLPESFTPKPILPPKETTVEEIIERSADFDEQEIKHIYLNPYSLAESIEAEIQDMKPDAIIGKRRRDQVRQFAIDSHAEERRQIKARNKEMKTEALNFKKKHPTWKKTDIANQLSKKYPLKSNTIRRII